MTPDGEGAEPPRAISYEGWLSSCLPGADQENYRTGAIPPGSRGVIPAEYLSRAVKAHLAKEISATQGLRCYGFTIAGDLHLENAEVPFALFLENCRFTGDLYLWRIETVTLSFVGSILERGMDIRGAELRSNFIMRDATSRGPVIARDMKIRGTAEFTGAEFLYDGQSPTAFAAAAENGCFGFSRSSAAALYWRRMKTKPKGDVVLRDATVGALMHDLDTPEGLSSWPQPGKLVLEGFRYDRFERCPVERALKWLDLQPHFTASSYSALARAYGRLNLRQQAEDVLAELKKHEIAEIRSPLRRWFNYAIYTVIGYGQRPERALVLFLALFAVHLGVVSWATNSGRMQPVVNELLLEPCFYGKLKACDKDIEQWRQVRIFGAPRFIPPSYPEIGPARYSLESFMPIFQFDQRRYWEPQSFSLNVVLSLLAGLGLFLGGLFVGAVSGLLSPRLKSEN